MPLDEADRQQEQHEPVRDEDELQPYNEEGNLDRGHAPTLAVESSQPRKQPWHDKTKQDEHEERIIAARKADVEKKQNPSDSDRRNQSYYDRHDHNREEVGREDEVFDEVAAACRV